MKRILLIVGGLVIVLVVAAVIFLFTGLGAAIKAVVEGVGSRATQSDVHLASADVSLTSGEGVLKGLVVGNPKGFSTPSAIELGEIRVKLDTSTVTSDVVVIKEIVIDGPSLTYEVGPGGSNIGVIQDNVAAFGGGTEKQSPGGGAASAGTQKPAKQTKAEGTKLIIESLVIKNGHVGVSASFLGGKALGASLPEIRLHDIGKASGGATTAEVAKQVLDALTHGALDAVSGLNLDGLKAGVEKGVGGAVDAVKGIFGGKKK